MEQRNLLLEATEFIQNCYAELNKTSVELDARLAQMKASIIETGTYTHSYEELSHGARMAWRNSNRCIGRLFWERLEIIDHRGLQETDHVAEALFNHIERATNDGRIKPIISIFPQEHQGRSIRIWNHQLLRYAGYQNDGVVVGDPASLQFTEVCRSFGWEGEGGHFDILPLVIDDGDGKPVWYDIPKDIVMEVPITHETYKGINELQMKWYAVPIISDMKLVIGGISYCAAPFNGWYMGTEIGARNLVDETRYNMLPKVAAAMGLATDHASSLWKDRAVVELNAAVLDSYKAHGVTIVDHHTAAAQFQRFSENEERAERVLTGRWSWLVPPLSPATTHVFHSSYEDKQLWPNFVQQAKPYEHIEEKKLTGCPFHTTL